MRLFAALVVVIMLSLAAIITSTSAQAAGAFDATTHTAIVNLYITYFNRPADYTGDEFGLSWWGSAIQTNLDNIVHDFAPPEQMQQHKQSVWQLLPLAFSPMMCCQRTTSRRLLDLMQDVQLSDSF